MPTPRELLDRLDSRHDELIRKLDELNAQIELTLAQFGKSRAAVSPALEPRTDSVPVVEVAPRRAA